VYGGAHEGLGKRSTPQSWSKQLIIFSLCMLSDNDENFVYFVLPVKITMGNFILFPRARYQILADGRYSHPGDAKVDCHDALYYRT
jgi:hypothetical protein